MGGKIWSRSEEEYFWERVVGQSDKNLHALPSKSWDRLADEMQMDMGSEARRQYRGSMLLEHFYQNADNNRFSPNARGFVEEYLERRKRLNVQSQSLVSPPPVPPPPVRRRSSYIRLVTEASCTPTSQTQPPHTVINGDELNAPSPVPHAAAYSRNLISIRSLIHPPDAVSNGANSLTEWIDVGVPFSNGLSESQSQLSHSERRHGEKGKIAE
ncbi:hypothetical protein F4802DRAFT_594465 [Xylaria palmicola]|nr:hypothetical protein F4802DRAFT_594465 [Xylaria palmicola]